jgi:hypothetical protein
MIQYDAPRTSNGGVKGLGIGKCLLVQITRRFVRWSFVGFPRVVLDGREIKTELANIRGG